MTTCRFANERETYAWLLFAMFAVTVPTAVVLLYVPAPYGRFARTGWGVQLPGKLSWIVFEGLSPIVYIFSFFLPECSGSVSPQINFTTMTFLTMWTVHYFNRAFIYPLRTPSMAPQSISVVLSAVLFNSLNAYLNGRWAGVYGDYGYGKPRWSPPGSFALGLVLFAVGMWINVKSDGVLFLLRTKKKTDTIGKEEAAGRYFIPRGGFFQFVSCPHYLGEIIEWIGYAMATWSLPGLCFAVCTFANLVPRALSTHDWYKRTFGKEYPVSRRALIPFIL